MRFPALSRWLVGVVSTVAIDLIGTPAGAQVRLQTLDEVRRELTPDDVISIVRTSGDTIRGRLVRFGGTDLDIRTEAEVSAAQSQRREITVPLSDLRSLERPRDSSKNGALIGAAIGGGSMGGMFVWAVSVDRNEIDEWGPSYLAAGGLFTGVGALLGWAIDRAHSKPYIRFDAPSPGAARIQVMPFRGRGAGLALTVTY